jgi:branched-chain amino acid transport system ATP-binding protein
MSLSQQLVKPLRDISIADNVALAAASDKTKSPLRALLNVSTERELGIAQVELARVGIASMASQSPGIQPLGVLKRLELARALATQPRLLLLDEVLAGLNPQEIAEMIPVVRGIADGGVTVLMIEHVMQAVMNLAGHVWVLAQGQLIAEGSPAQVTADERVIEAYLGHGTAARLRAAAAGEAA